ncbi:MAG: hypothetical protein V6Z82_06705 [Flavobacteriales bacterium]
MERHLVGRGRAAQFSGLVALASVGVPLAIGLVKKILEKGLLTEGPKGRGVQILRDVGRFKKNKVKDVPVTNIDLRKWCNYLRIPIKCIFSRDEVKLLPHSPCNLMILEIWGPIGRAQNKTFEYFDSFGLPPPLEWEKEMALEGSTQKQQPNPIGTEREIRV